MGVIKININTIVNYINERLAGEQLLYSQLLVFLDGTIDDINQALNSNFPAFSEFSEKDENYPDYNFFPDRYIRTVVVTGACAKFYICDEEGAAVAEQYQYEYKEKLFLMVRDYSHQVPEKYRAEHQGYMIDYTSKDCQFLGDSITYGAKTTKTYHQHLKELVNEIIELLNEVEAKDNRISLYVERR